ncbi:DUF222 domain-containing protein [Microbispora rosea]|uniref:HNH endonuclease signature motif containing protein n=1 Tax=Microbispora rosea TaxID=58117 RepID=UPI0034441691
MDLFDIHPERPRRSSDGDGEWWDRLTAGSPLWSSDGSCAREPFPIIVPEPRQHASQDTSTVASGGSPGAGSTGGSRTDTAGTHADGADATGAEGPDAGASDVGGHRRGRSSWALVGSVRESAQELALAPLPDDADICLAEAEELLFARDRITCALADRVGRVHAAGQAKQHGHASTRSWLRTAAGMTVGGAGRLLMLVAELPRLPQVREKFAAGELAAGVVEAICAAVAGLSDEQAALAEPILLELAGKAGAAEVAKAGRYLRAVLDPDGEERDERADYGRRFLRVRPGKDGGVEGEFYLAREAGARLMALLHAYAKQRAEGDDRPLTVRQADALIAALEQEIATELLVVVNAESLPTDPEDTDTTEDTRDAEGFEEGQDDTGDSAPGEANDTSDPAPGEADHLDTAEADAGAGSDGDADGAVDAGVGSAEDVCDIAEADVSGVGTAEADPATDSTGDRAEMGHLGDLSDLGSTDAATAPAAGSGDAAAGLRDEESRGCGVGDRGTGERRPGACEPRDTASTASAEGNHTVNAASGECDETAPVEGDGGDRGVARSGATCARRGAPAWPAEGGGHSHTAPSHTAPSGTAPWGTASSGATASDAPPSHAAPSEAASSEAASSEAAQPDPPPKDASAHHTHAGPRPAGDCRHGQGIPGALGTALGTVPGLLLATGQVLPVSGVHRLARTSSLVRLVMDAEGQVLDMGRKVRLATPAQRRAVFARYATCWVDGCPLPATMCQIDHADNWCTGGLTDLKLLGPACQFHNRDRYQHPERYTRRKVGTDRWAFTYHRLGRVRRLRE